MKNYRNKFFIFVASITVGFLLVINIGIDKTDGFLNMSAAEYRDALEEKNKLYDEIAVLSDSNYELSKKISSFNVGENGSKKVIEHMKEQLNEYSILSGVTEVKGPGIVLTIHDGTYDIYSDDALEVNRRTFHSADAALVLNELRTAGAEGIAINNYRVLNNTGLDCGWAFIRFDDKEMEGSPFKFYAIGDPEVLEEAMYREGSHINQLLIRKVNVKIEKHSEIILPKSKKSLTPEFMKRADN